MRDQAQKLRDIISKNNKEMKRKFSSKVITITSGKGGVGKSNIALNLALKFIEQGKKTLVIDADMGLANIEILLGMVPKYNLSDVIKGKKIITDIITECENGLKFISGGSGIESLRDLNENQINYFSQNLALLDKIFDIIIIDTGAGIADSVLTFLSFADEILLVTTAEPTAITDAYALLKVFSGKVEEDNIEVKLLINRINEKNEGIKIFEKLNKVSEKFLNLKISYLGDIPADIFLEKAVRLQSPVSVSYPKSESARAIKEIAKKMIDSNDRIINDKGIQHFIGFIKSKLVSKKD